MPSHFPMVYPRVMSPPPPLFTLYTIPSVTSFPVSVSPTICMLMTPKYISIALHYRNFNSSFAELTECLTHVQKWMDGVKLKLNPEKTEFIIIGDKHARVPSCKNFPPSFPYELKKLGVIFDSGNIFPSHITKVCYA